MSGEICAHKLVGTHNNHETRDVSLLILRNSLKATSVK